MQPIKVYPITLVKTQQVPGGNAVAVPHVQANVDANEGYVPHEFGKLDHKGRVAIVGYGPSLRRTMGELKDYDFIWTVSGAHDFLLAHDITPTIHTDVDFRKHKRDLVNAHPSVRYIIGSTVHPEYAHALKGYQTTMFQPVGAKTDKWFRIREEYPKVKFDGDVAMAAIALAVSEGFKDITTFGLDYSEEPGMTHADTHGGMAQEPMYVTDLDFKLYRTTNNLLVGCDAFINMMRGLPADVSVTVVSDGLLPAWIDMVEARDNG